MRQRANDDGGPGYLRTSLHRKFPREFIMAKKTYKLKSPCLRNQN